MITQTLKNIQLASLFAALSSTSLFAADYSWDPLATSGIQYGNGTWDTSTSNWSTDNGATRTTWNNATGSTNNVSFPSSVSGTAPAQVTVNLGSDINVQQIGMGGGYASNVLITGPHSLHFSGGSQLLSNNNAGKTLRIDVSIASGGNIQKTNAGTVILSQNNAYSGTTTITTGTLQIGAGGSTGTLGAGDVINNAALLIDRSTDYTIANNISGSGTFAKTGAGTVILEGANTYAGQTTVWAGTVRLGADNRLASTSNLRLSGQGKFSTGGFTQSLGTLALINNAATSLDFGAGASSLSFADSSSVSWSGNLELLGFTIGTDSLRFGTSGSALTLAQLAAISLAGHGPASLDANGYVVFTAIPEPGTYATALGAFALVVAAHCRRRK